MTEDQFMNELETLLDRLSKAERTDILLDIQEYFAEGRKDGKADQEIAKALGTPTQIAEDLLASYALTKKDGQPQATNGFVSITNDQFQHIDLHMQHGALIVRPSPNNVTTLELSGAYEKLALTAEVVGETLFIRLKSLRHWLFPFNFNVRTVTLNLFVPQKLYLSFVMKLNNGRIDMMKILSKSLSLHTNNGRVDLSEIAASALTAKTGNGRLTLEKIQVENLNVRTFNGRIEMHTTDADTVFVQSNNGRIELNDIVGEVTGRTANGRITLQTTHLNQPIDLKTNNGIIQISTNEKPTNVAIQAKTNNGRIELFGERHAYATFGNGEHNIRLRSGNGRIIVKAEEV